MTAKRSIVFRYVTRPMFHISDATIHTLRELMKAGGTEKHHEHIEEFEGTPRRFLETKFDSEEFTNIKTQLLRHLCGVLKIISYQIDLNFPIGADVRQSVQITVCRLRRLQAAK